MYEVRKGLKEHPFYIKEGLLDYEFYPDTKLEIWGKYNGEDTFAGTDKLSMAVQRDIPDHMRNNPNKILIEGDRFLNSKFLDIVSDKRIIILQANDKIIQKRFQQRGSNQSETFLKSRFTKVNNIKDRYPHEIWINENEKDLQNNANKIKLMLLD